MAPDASADRAARVTEGGAGDGIEDLVRDVAGSGLREGQDVHDGVAVDGHGKRAAHFGLLEQRVGLVEHVGMGHHHVGDGRAGGILSAHGGRKLAVVEEVAAGESHQLGFRVAGLILRQKTERDDVLVRDLFLVGVHIIIGGTFESENGAADHFLRAEGAVGDDVGGLGSPLILAGVGAVTGDDILAERNERDGGAGLEELVEVDFLLELDLEGIGIDGGYAEVVDGRVAFLDGAGVLHLIQQGGRFAGIDGLEDPLPRVDIVRRLDGTAVAPAVVVEVDQNDEFAVLVLVDLIALHAGFLPFAVLVELREAFVHLAHDLELRIVDDAALGVKIKHLGGEVHVDDGAFVIIAGIGLFQGGASCEGGCQHHRAKDQGQHLFHDSVFPPVSARGAPVCCGVNYSHHIITLFSERINNFFCARVKIHPPAQLQA